MTKEDIYKTVYDLILEIYVCEGSNSTERTLGEIMGIMSMASAMENLVTSEPPEHDGCKDCRFEGIAEGEAPCRICKQSYADNWERAL